MLIKLTPGRAKLFSKGAGWGLGWGKNILIALNAHKDAIFSKSLKTN